jgi:hypothetical protein
MDFSRYIAALQTGKIMGTHWFKLEKNVWIEI